MGFPLPEICSPCFTERLWPSHWELVFSHLDCPNFRQQIFVEHVYFFSSTKQWRLKQLYLSKLSLTSIKFKISLVLGSTFCMGKNCACLNRGSVAETTFWHKLIYVWIVSVWKFGWSYLHEVADISMEITIFMYCTILSTMVPELL